MDEINKKLQEYDKGLSAHFEQAWVTSNSGITMPGKELVIEYVHANGKREYVTAIEELKATPEYVLFVVKDMDKANKKKGWSYKKHKEHNNKLREKQEKWFKDEVHEISKYVVNKQGKKYFT